MVEIVGMSHYLFTNGSGVLELQVAVFLDPKLKATEKKAGCSMALKWRPASEKRSTYPSLPQTKLIIQWKARSTKSQLLALLGILCVGDNKQMP